MMEKTDETIPSREELAVFIEEAAVSVTNNSCFNINTYCIGCKIKIFQQIINCKNWFRGNYKIIKWDNVDIMPINCIWIKSR